MANSISYNDLEMDGVSVSVCVVDNGTIILGIRNYSVVGPYMESSAHFTAAQAGEIGNALLAAAAVFDVKEQAA